jgi:hypothetical protein
MSLFAQFATNRKAEAEGILVTFGGDTKFRIARKSKANKRYKKMVDAEIKPHMTAIRNDTMDVELDEEITRKVFCNTILLGWEKMDEKEVFDESEYDVVEPGNDQKYVGFTPERAMKLMKALPDLYEALNENATKMSNFRDETREADAKN